MRHEVKHLSRVNKGWRITCSCGQPLPPHRRVIDAYRTFEGHLMAQFRAEEEGTDA